MRDKKENIILIGFKGSGKTTIGKIVASKSEKVFADTDTLIELLHKERTGEAIPFREIFKNRGKEYFSSLEEKAIEKISVMDYAVISLGGGTLFGAASEEEIKKLGIIIFLYVEKNELYDRIVANGVPPFFNKENPKKSFDSIYQKRIDTYRAISNIIVDNSHTTPEEAGKIIMKELKGYNVR